MADRRKTQPVSRRKPTDTARGPIGTSGGRPSSAARPAGRPSASGSRRPPSKSGASVRGRPPEPRRDPRASRTGRIQEVQQRRKRKRKRNYTLYYILLFFFLTIAGIVLSLTVFFNIKTIEVTGSSIYSTADVLPILGAKEGDNLLRLNTERLRQNVLEGLLRSDQVAVKRVFPSTLRIEVTDGVPEVQMETSGDYYSLSRSGRILEIGTEPQPDHGIILLGVDLSGLKVGDSISEKENADASAGEEAKAAAEAYRIQLQAVQSFFSALTEAQISGVTAVDLSDEIKLTLYWENRIQVILGSFSELTYKLQLCKAILEDPTQLSADAKGVLDAENASSAGVFYQSAPDLAVPGGGMGGVWNWDDAEAEENPPEEDTSSPESSEEPLDVVSESSPEGGA